MSHVSAPWGRASVGKMASRWVRREKFLGVRVSMLRAARELLWAGMLTVSGPRKMVFSVLAVAGEVVRRRPSKRLWRNMVGRGGG